MMSGSMGTTLTAAMEVILSGSTIKCIYRKDCYEHNVYNFIVQNSGPNADKRT